RPRRRAPELVPDRQVRAADDARADRPEFLARIVLAEDVEVADLRPLVAGDAHDLSLFDRERLARPRWNIDGAQMPTRPPGNLGVGRALLIIEPQRRTFFSANGG